MRGYSEIREDMQSEADLRQEFPVKFGGKIYAEPALKLPIDKWNLLRLSD